MNLQGTFVSEKISKIRFKRDSFNPSNSFLTATWDNHSLNQITLWNLTDHDENDDDDESYPTAAALVSSYAFLGDVTELKQLTPELFVASSSHGSVTLLRILEDLESCSYFKPLITWQSIHHFRNNQQASCTALSNFQSDIATVGEDGRINLLTASTQTPVRTIHNADSCSIYCVHFLRHSEILTGNSQGRMKVWDLRNHRDVPATTFHLSDRVKTEATCISHHPTQRHIVVAGAGDGSLTVWDLRRNTYPMSRLDAHAKSVSEIFFHPDRPENLFTCSTSGQLWHWNNNKNSKLTLDSADNTHWLNSTSTNSKVSVTSLCAGMHKPINSMDIDGSTLLFGCDNEAMYVVKNVAI